MKHAFLIIANNDVYVLNKLIDSIDASNHDIYIMIDKKSSINNNEIKSSMFSKIYFLNRIKIYWGDYSLIKAEMNLFKEASKGEYDYYHLISGVDLMIKTNKYFDDFFELNKGKEFLTFCGKDWIKSAESRIKYYHINTKRNNFLKKIDSAFLLLQKIFKINRLRKNNINIYGGSNWASLTNCAVNFIISNEDKIKKIFNHCFCGDEVYKHTILGNSEFMKNVYYFNDNDINDDNDTNMYLANMRYIDWVRGKPYTFLSNDINDLRNSPYLFARKFSSTIDKKIVDDIVQENSKQI